MRNAGQALKPGPHSFMDDCGMRILDCGLEESWSFNPQSAIANPQFMIRFSLFQLDLGEDDEQGEEDE